MTTYYVGALYEYTTWNGGSSTSKFYYFGSQRVAMKQDINISYLHGDHLGSTNKTTGASSSTQTYYPYGATKSSSGTVPTDYGFTGQKRDATANLMFYGARYYDPALARFVQPDTIVPNPMDPQSLNRYSYVRNNPVNRIDPTGHEDCAPEDDWCWENRWYEAHGQCWSDAKQDWSKQCQPEFQDEDILKEVLGEIGGLEIVQKTDFSKLVQLLNDAANFAKGLLPSVAYVSWNASFQLGWSGNWGISLILDFAHRQIGLFGYRSDQELGTPSVGFGITYGVGWGGANYKSIWDVEKYSLSLGSTLLPFVGLDLSTGIDGPNPFAAANSDGLTTIGISGGYGEFDLHMGSRYTEALNMPNYGPLVWEMESREAMAVATFGIVSYISGNPIAAADLAIYAAVYPQ